jgi:hypothetical protein
MSVTTKWENFRIIKDSQTFTGAAFKGLNGSVITFTSIANGVKADEYIYEVFYRVTTPLTVGTGTGDTSGNPATTYLQVGIEDDAPAVILTPTTGIVDTLNTNNAGFKPQNLYTKAVINRAIVGAVGGTDSITGGTIELTLVIGRNNPFAEIEIDITESSVD